MNHAAIADFLTLLTDAEMATLRDKLKAKLLDNVRYVSLSIAGKSVGQTELVDSAFLMGLVASELRRRNLSDIAAPARRTVARFA